MDKVAGVNFIIEFGLVQLISVFCFIINLKIYFKFSKYSIHLL